MVRTALREKLPRSAALLLLVTSAQVMFDRSTVFAG